MARALGPTFVMFLLLALSASAQTAPPQSPGAAARPPAAPATAQQLTPPADYIIGPDDVLSISFWRDKDLSSDVIVRPDGKISFWLINDVQAAGLTPDQLRLAVEKAAGQFMQDKPTVLVVVKTINSRKVFITGQVAKPSVYPLGGPTTVLQLIATAGGLTEYADSKNIRVIRTENGKSVSYRFNYNDVAKGEKLQQNIELRPGDQVIVR